MVSGRFGTRHLLVLVRSGISTSMTSGVLVSCGVPWPTLNSGSGWVAEYHTCETVGGMFGGPPGTMVLGGSWNITRVCSFYTDCI